MPQKIFDDAAKTFFVRIRDAVSNLFRKHILTLSLFIPVITYIINSQLLIPNIIITIILSSVAITLISKLAQENKDVTNFVENRNKEENIKDKANRLASKIKRTLLKKRVIEVIAATSAALFMFLKTLSFILPSTFINPILDVLIVGIAITGLAHTLISEKQAIKKGIGFETGMKIILFAATIAIAVTNFIGIVLQSQALTTISTILSVITIALMAYKAISHFLKPQNNTTLPKPVNHGNNNDPIPTAKFADPDLMAAAGAIYANVVKNSEPAKSHHPSS